jgi:hypothetical protein
VADKNSKTESQIQEEFRKKRRNFRLLVVGLLALMFLYGRFVSVEERAASGNIFTIGCVILLVAAAWAVFRCPICRASLRQTRWLPWRRSFYCPQCGVRFTG